MQLGFINTSVHARLQVSVCNDHDLFCSTLANIQTHTHSCRQHFDQLMGNLQPAEIICEVLSFDLLVTFSITLYHHCDGNKHVFYSLWMMFLLYRDYVVPVYMPRVPRFHAPRPAAPKQTPCKFFPRCTDMNCPFLHPKASHVWYIVFLWNWGQNMLFIHLRFVLR